MFRLIIIAFFQGDCRHKGAFGGKTYRRPLFYLNGKGKSHPITGHEGPDGKQRNSSTLSLTSMLGVGGCVNATPRPLYPKERHSVPIVQEAGWVSGPIFTKAENLTSTEIRYPASPARSESLYRLRYPGPLANGTFKIKLFKYQYLTLKFTTLRLEFSNICVGFCSSLRLACKFKWFLSI